MSLAVQITMAVVSVVPVTAGASVTLRRVLAPRGGPDGFVAAPEERSVVARADAVVRRAVRTVRWPSMAIWFVAILTAERLHGALASAIVYGAGFTLFVAWHTIGMRLWWRWALRQDADPALVAELAADAILVWKPTSWIGRWQRRTWLAIPATNPRDVPPSTADS